MRSSPDDPVELYLAQVAEIANDSCDDSWFPEALSKYRAGDELAGREISGSCLGIVVRIAKAKWTEKSRVGLLDLIQEGNASLMNTLVRFTGSKAREFVERVEQNVDRRLKMLLEQPWLVEWLSRHGTLGHD